MSPWERILDLANIDIYDVGNARLVCKNWCDNLPMPRRPAIAWGRLGNPLPRILADYNVHATTNYNNAVDDLNRMELDKCPLPLIKHYISICVYETPGCFSFPLVPDQDACDVLNDAFKAYFFNLEHWSFNVGFFV